MFIPMLLFLCLFIPILKEYFFFFQGVGGATGQTVILLFYEGRLLSVQKANFNQKKVFENLGCL